MTQPAPRYQPYQPMAPMMGAAAPPRPPKGGVTMLLAGVLALVVTGLTLGGLFGPISLFRDSYEDEGASGVAYEVEYSWWGFTVSGDGADGSDGQSYLAGLTLVLAATLLVLGAVFAFVASRPRAAGAISAARSLISSGVGVLAGAMLLQLFFLIGESEQYNEQELRAGQSVEFAPGFGTWLPTGGVALGVVAVVLAHVGRRPGAGRMEPNTPRMGFPAPYGYRPQMPLQQQAPVAERQEDVQISDEDAAADTQVVDGATAGGGTPPEPADATPAPATASPGGAPATPAAEQPVTPATTSADAEPAAPPSEETQKQAGTEQPGQDASGTEATAGERPAPLTDLPAAPPAPELSSSDEKNSGDK